MARLEWRPIDAPQGSIRDIALAGSNIVNSFDRMGQMLFDREARLRKEATDEQAAQVLMANDEAGVAAALQQAMSTGNRRVDTNILARLANEQRNTVLTREGLRQDNWIKGDQIKDKESLTEWSGELPALLQSHYGGDRGAMAAELSRISASESGRRFLNQRYGDAWKAFEGGVDDRREQLSDDRTHQRGLASVAAQREANTLARDKWNFEKSRLLADEARTREALAFADTFTEKMPARFSTEDSIAGLRRAPAFRNLDSRVKTAVLARLRSEDFGRDAYLTPTSDSLTAQTIVPIQPGEPGSLVGNAEGISAQGLSDRLNRIRDQTERVRDAFANRFDAKNMGSAIIAESKKYANVTPDEVYKAAQARGISIDDVEAVRTASGNQMSYPEIMATLQKDGKARDPGFFSMRALDPVEYFFGGERVLHNRALEVARLKGNEGDLARATNERASLLRKPEQVLAEVAQLDAEIRRATAVGQLSPAQRSRVLQLEARLSRLQEMLRPPQE